MVYPVMDQYIFEVSDPQSPQSPQFWPAPFEGQCSSPSTEWNQGSSPTIPLCEPNEEFFIYPEALVTLENYHSGIQNGYAPRPREGNEASSKAIREQRRRLQNRRSQQAFRDRQAQRVKALELNVAELLERRREYEEATKRAGGLEQMVQDLMAQKQELENACAELKARYDKLRDGLKSLVA